MIMNAATLEAPSPLLHILSFQIQSGQRGSLGTLYSLRGQTCVSSMMLNTEAFTSTVINNLKYSKVP